MGRNLRNFSTLFAIAKFGGSLIGPLIKRRNGDIQAFPQKSGDLSGMFKLSHLPLARLV